MILLGEDLLLSAKNLTSFNIPIGTIKTGKFANNNGAPSWQFIEIDGIVYFIFDKLPARTKEKLPSKDALIADIKREQVNEKEERYVRSLEYQKKECFVPHYNYINQKYTLPKEKVREFAEKLAVWEWIIKGKHKANKHLFAAYCKVMPGHVSSIIAFCTFRNKCLKKGIEANVVDGRTTRKHDKRISVAQLTFLQAIYVKPQKFTSREAHDKLIKYCEEIGEEAYSLASVKLYFKEFYHDQVLHTARYGEGAAQRKQPYVSRRQVEHRNTQWVSDGWTLPFWVVDESSEKPKYNRFTLYLVRDAHSRKILSYGVSPSEDTLLILNGLEEAMRSTGVFPHELVCDKHSFHKTGIAARLKAETEKMGAVWTVTMNAQRNALAERYNQYLDSYCKEYAGYLGKNMTAKGKDARPAPEAVEGYRKTLNHKTVEEIKVIAASIVLQFNKKKLPALGGLSPNEAYAASEDKHSFAVSEAECVDLVRPGMARKVERGQINIIERKKKYEFKLSDELIDRYNEREVFVVYEDLSQGIYISDIKTGEQLGCVLPKELLAGAIADQTESDKKKFLKQAGRKKAAYSRSEKKIKKTEAECLREKPEAAERIAAHKMDKDVLKEMLQDRELLKEMNLQGINKNKLPDRSAAKVEDEPATGKTKGSPFTPVDHVPKMISILDTFKL